MEELQIFEGNTQESSLELSFCEEELSEEQKAAFELQTKYGERYKKLRASFPHRKKSNSCELWMRTKNLTKTISSTTNTNLQRIQVPNNNNTYSLIVANSSAGTQSIMTGRLVNSTVNNLRISQPGSTVSPNVAQPMSGTKSTQQMAVRSLIRQTTPNSTFATRPTTASAMIASRAVNPNTIQINQQQFSNNMKKMLTPTTTLQARPGAVPSTTSPIKKISSGPRLPGLVPQSFGQNSIGKSTGFRQPTQTNGPILQKNPIQLNKVVGHKSPVVAGSNKGGTSQEAAEGTMVNGNSDTNNNTNSATGNAKTFPSLVVNVKPCLHEKPTKVEATTARTELDQKVKQILMYTTSKFTEWLMQQGLLRVDHLCNIHKTSDNQPVKFVLGMFNDKDNLPTSGGFVWISDCCPGRQISVFEGSIFESPQHNAATLLKLMYHWSCQTSATNVLNWCKVNGSYLKNFYTLLRSVCVGALHGFCPKMGGPGKFIEVGIITLGTTLTAPTGKKHVKIEILGVFDPASKIIRMKLVNPANTNVSERSKSRGVQILSPISLWVERSSTVVIDNSIEQNLLVDMGFKNIVRCQSNAENETNSGTHPTNINVMKYLKHVVPKMFNATLCVLSKSLIQQFLDELSWRERWGKTSKDTFNNILNHIVIMTKWEFGTEKNLVAWLNKVSMNPFNDWSYTRQYAPVLSGIDLLPDSIRKADMPALQAYEKTPPKRNSNGLTLTNFMRGGGGKPPILAPQVPLMTINSPPKRKLPDSVSNGSRKKFMAMPPRLTSKGVANQYNINEHNLTFHGVQDKNCIECTAKIARPEHYPGHMSCIKCRFSTCCKAAMKQHHVTAHPNIGIGKSFPSIKVNEMPMMEKPLLCACEFQTIDPNRLARHLALCDKTTAFPLDWEEQKKKRAGLPPPEPLSILDHLGLMRNKSGK